MADGTTKIHAVPRFSDRYQKESKSMKRSSTELGQGLAEYAFLLILIVIVIIAVLQVLGISVVDLYNWFVSRLGEAFSF